MRTEITDEVLCDCFRVFRGGKQNLGIKSQWWAHLVEYEEEELVVEIKNRWRPSKEQITLAEQILFEVIPKLSLDDRRMIALRCGKGFTLSYRKCGQKLGIHHEVFRQQYQQVIVMVQKTLDEMA